MPSSSASEAAERTVSLAAFWRATAIVAPGDEISLFGHMVRVLQGQHYDAGTDIGGQARGESVVNIGDAAAFFYRVRYQNFFHAFIVCYLARIIYPIFPAEDCKELTNEKK